MVDESSVVGKEADDIFGGVGFAKLSEVEALVALAEALALFVAKQGEMTEGGWGEAEEAMQVDLLGDGEEQVAATDDFGNAHQGVIYDYGELIGPGSIGTAEDKVTAVGGEVDAVGAVMEITKHYIIIRNEQTSCPHPLTLLP